MNARLALVLLLAAAPVAAERYPQRPDGVADFVVDEALLLDARDEEAVNDVCRRLLFEEGIPILVVTIPSLASYEARGPIESYARALFDHWGIGSPERNRGMLLLVARADRKARIELGADWGRRKDDDARSVMRELIIPSFKRGRFGVGVRRGVAGLDRLARGRPVVPGGGTSWVRMAVIVALVGLFVFIAWRSSRDAARTARWTTRRHRWRSHWRTRQAYRDRRDEIAYGASSADAGGWSGTAGGGSFGGGSSGGGGATGSW